MTYLKENDRFQTPCGDCPLRKLSAFEEFSPHTLKFMQQFKVGELKIEAGTQLLMEGHSSPQLFTLLRGMGLRYKTLEDGDRQVVNFIFPGDFIGMQAGILGEMKHSVEATTAMTLCVFDRKEIWQVFRNEPQRAFSLTWLVAIEEHFLGEALAAIGQRSAIQRVAWALLRIHRRLTALELNNGSAVPLPYRQRDIADAVGLSLVHTNKTLAELRKKQLASWVDGHLVVSDKRKLAKVAGVDLDSEVSRRPLI